MHEEGLSLRHYVELLVDKWVWLALATVAAILVVVMATSLLPEAYRAEATLAILRSRTEVEFDPRIQTLSDYELSRTDADSRQEGLIALVTSNEVVGEVLQEVGNSLEPSEQTASVLRGMVRVESTGDLININVRYRDPETATQIANSWAQHFERYVNRIYSGSSGVGNTPNQVQTAEARYEEAQSALETYASDDPVSALERQIAAKKALLDSYQQTLVRMEVNPIATEQALLDSYYQELEQIEGWLADATSLREQVSADSGSDAGNAANSLALILLRSRVFGSGGAGPGIRGQGDTVGATDNAPVLQLDLGDIRSEAIQPADVDALIRVLESRRESAQERIDTLVSAVNNGEVTGGEIPSESELMERISVLEDEITDLQGEVEAQNAQRRELEQARDQAWDTYLVLLGKQVEEEIATDSPAAEVRIADRAIVPTEPVGKGLIRNSMLAAIVTLMFSATAIVFLDWWQTAEPAARPQIETRGSSGEPTALEHPGSEETTKASQKLGRVPDSVT